MIKFKYPDGTEFVGVVHDVGGAVKGLRIDVWVENHDTALQKGTFTTRVEVIRP